MLSDKRLIQPRRTLQQIKHCVEEALSVIENKEDPRCAYDDLIAAQDLIAHILKTVIVPMAMGSEKGFGNLGTPTKTP
jgi:hypothetical protein